MIYKKIKELLIALLQNRNNLIKVSKWKSRNAKMYSVDYRYSFILHKGVIAETITNSSNNDLIDL